jgi:DNA-binding GntR family transcriptional regulator
MKTASTSLPSRSDSATSRLRADILDGTLDPGTLLAETGMAERLGVSRVPVREALFALEREGLVEFSHSGRAFVKVLTPQDFEELHVLRLALEPAAARLAAPQLRKDATALEKNLVAMRRAKSVRQIARLDLDFHELILAASGNTRLLKLWRILRGELELWLGRLHRRHQVQTEQTLHETLEAHASIIQCFRSQSPAECERVIYKHVQGWREWLPTVEVKL